MKGLLMAAIFVLNITFMACNKNVASTSVPEDVITAFNSRYPTAKDAKWDLNEGLYEVKFKEGNKKKEAYYQSDGDLVRVEE